MDYAELAKDPKAFDTRLAELHKQHDQLTSRIHAVEERAHVAVRL